MTKSDVWATSRGKIVAAVEARLVAKTAELKEQLHAMVDKIEVSDFQVVDGKVKWKVKVPPTLLTLIRQLPDALSPNDD